VSIKVRTSVSVKAEDEDVYTPTGVGCSITTIFSIAASSSFFLRSASSAANLASSAARTAAVAS
jgi:hypothetical protein